MSDSVGQHVDGGENGMPFMAELFNSAIEALCDFVEERHNEKIKVIKDIAAAAVGMSILLWVTVMVMEIWQLF